MPHMQGRNHDSGNDKKGDLMMRETMNTIDREKKINTLIPKAAAMADEAMADSEAKKNTDAYRYRWNTIYHRAMDKLAVEAKLRVA